MEKGNPHVRDAGASDVAGHNPKASSTTLHANQAMKLRLAALKWEWRLAR